MIYDLFKTIVNNLTPLYSSMVFEYPLECLSQIIEERKSNAFRNFYLNENAIANNSLERLLNFSEANNIYREKFNKGYFFSCYPYFNPLNKAVENSIAYKLSEIAQAGIIG
jgi:hypothetical protein